MAEFEKYDPAGDQEIAKQYSYLDSIKRLGGARHTHLVLKKL